MLHTAVIKMPHVCTHSSFSELILQDVFWATNFFLCAKWPSPFPQSPFLLILFVRVWFFDNISTVWDMESLSQPTPIKPQVLSLSSNSCQDRLHYMRATNKESCSTEKSRHREQNRALSSKSTWLIIWKALLLNKIKYLKSCLAHCCTKPNTLKI